MAMNNSSTKNKLRFVLHNSNVIDFEGLKQFLIDWFCKPKRP